MLNWGIIGCGHIAHTFADGLACLPEGQLVACASNSRERAQQWVNDYQSRHPTRANVSAIYSDYESLLKDNNVNAIYVANTHNFHFESVKLCLEYKKHVLCEKPITLNSKQAAELYDLAKANNCFLMEAVWTRFLPAIRMLQKVLSDNIIGDIQSVNVDFSIGRMKDESHRLRNKALAGGALLDLGIYPITFAYIVFGQSPKHIQSSVSFDTTGVDMASFYLFKYEDGQHASLSSSYNQCGPMKAVVAGTQGYIEVPFFLGAKGFTVHKDGEDLQNFSYPFEDHENFSFEIQHMHDCVKQSLTESPILPAQESIAVLQTMDALRAQWGLKYDGE
ncbi:Gfo/Idh/MocA family oxidoreductase [Glaciecola sp. MH2013]|uniref:Gfo/Idh/MocA family protein n=1 Tax=Glaciecola sp. MH2013 TaxID=2785524 RepID=UPI00189D5FFD|nr:Gfo/Idh/MocA family oxidoreductase [Glaciecola sp. MH2013]MBF7074211.1 Gfo/Idh/MocA family oxidoreductase [Glaciecola sp. MH2013]